LFDCKLFEKLLPNWMSNRLELIDRAYWHGVA
jgi:hypothetical protein